MKEIELIKAFLGCLVNDEKAKIKSCGLRRKKDINIVKSYLDYLGLPAEDIDKIEFKKSGPDVIAVREFGQGRAQKKIMVEAKGGGYFYNFYTMLGQFICYVRSPSSYYWFGFLLPTSWRDKVKRYLTLDSGEIKPIVRDIVGRYTKNGQGLYFYWVSDDRKIKRETWLQTLTRATTTD